jgi:NAD(P)-dependent dehydrogenase (short-subunit alcohol dehydrogenase family)
VWADTSSGGGAGRILADIIDGLLEASVVGSFSRMGFAARSRLGRWTPPPRLDGKVIVVTGASSGIGRAASVALARIGADLHLVGRNREGLAATQRAAVVACGGGRVEIAPVDLVDPAQIEAFARKLAASEDRLDALVHNAGALFPDYRTASDGTELTVATHVLAPFRLTWFLLPLLVCASSSVIVTVSSGGMYTQRFELDRLQSTAQGYNGVTAYARAKRAQVVLAHQWGRRWADDGVRSYVMHPGWVDTPGLATGLPSFARLGSFLRTPAQGADTIVWLAADGPRIDPLFRRRPIAPQGLADGIWLDRRRRDEYYVPTTYRSPANRRHDGDALWEWCAERTVSTKSPHLR